MSTTRINDDDLASVALYDKVNAIANEFDAETVKLTGDQDINGIKTFTDEIYAPNQLDYSRITNCITHIPQDIKLELVDGTLTLKAGSKVCFPNGSGVFNTVTTTADISASSLGAASGSSFVYFVNNNAFAVSLESQTTSGTEIPVNGCLYNTETNKIEHYTAGSFVRNSSFPIARITRTSGAITSIDQIFNGFGYIGRTPFGISFKGLMSDGYNQDGKYKNKEVTAGVTIHPPVGTGTFYLHAMDSGGLTTTVEANYYKQPTPPAFTKSSCWEDTQNNVIWKSLSSSTGWTDGTSLKVLNIGKFVSKNNSITSFTPKKPFRAVDYNDSSTISGWSMPSNKYIDLTLGASGTSYTAPANGWFQLGINYNINGGFVYLFNNENGLSVFHRHYNTNSVETRLFLPVSKNQKCTVGYNGLVQTNRFRFIYAEGEI